MAKLNIDGETHEFPDGITLIQACEMAGVEIPRFCYHERLSVAGNCRMCLVEVVGAPKPVASCAMGVGDLRPGRDGEPPAIRTNSELVKKAREGVMEFLLINHPLDCPICDQGGECDLQDQAMAYGVDSSRFAENKRAVEDKPIGPLVKTVMTRCIHCTRCVRFMTEVAGVEELGAIGRGEDVEITTYLEAGLSSELQGNVIDLCPVGALTSKPYAFTARPWELGKTETIDVSDALGANIRIDARGREVLRIQPRNNDDVNEEWISDKARFVWDGLARRRLDQPYIRRDGHLEPATWDEALRLAAERLGASEGSRIAALAGDLAGAEEMFALEELFAALDSPNIDCRQDGARLDPALGRETYLFNATIAGIDAADAILLVGTNPRCEAPVLNARIRKRYRRGGLRVGLIGEQVDLTYSYDYLGAGPKTLESAADGMGFVNALRHQRVERAMIVIGQGALAREDGRAVLETAARLAVSHGFLDEEAGWNGFSVLHAAAARVGGLDLGFVPAPGGLDAGAMRLAAATGDLDVCYLLGADEGDLSAFADTFVIYQGSHGDAGAEIADIILPGAAYSEKSATYVNTEGRAQMTARAVFPPGEAREDWAIIRALSGRLDRVLGYDTLFQLRAAMYKEAPNLAAIDTVEPAGFAGIRALAGAAGGGSLDDQPFVSVVDDFYLTNPIARASAVMAELSTMRRGANAELTGTDG